MVKLRESTSAVLWILVLAFGGLWVLQDSGAFEAIGMGGGGRNVATVNGAPVEGELFNNAVQQQTQVYQQQGTEITPTMAAQIEQQVFDGLVDNALVEAEMDRLGIAVTDDEVFDLITGETPDPLIAQIFPDGQGGVDRNALNQVVSDPQYAEQLAAVEEQVRRNRRQAKLTALVSAAARVSPAEVEAEFVRRSRTADVRFVGLRYADVPDDQVTVTDADLQAFYREREADFQRPRTWAIEVVQFDKAPTAADSARALAGLREAAAGLRRAADPAAFARQNGVGAEAEAAFVSADQLAPDLASALYQNLAVGRVVGPLVAGDQAVVARVVGVREAAAPVVRARHILLPAGQLQVARDLQARIASGAISFEQAARQFSQDESNKAAGGDLGWFGRGRMVSEFEQAAFAATPGQVVGPVETQFGVHLLRVEGRSAQEAQIVRITRPVEADADAVRESAEDFTVVDIEGEGRDFAEAAAGRGLTVTPTEVTEDAPYIPGVETGRELYRVLRRAEAGFVSDPIDAGDRFVVVRVTEVKEAGTIPFEEVRERIETDVQLAKKREVQAARLGEALAANADLGALATAAGAQLQTATGLAMGNPLVEGFGAEPALVGAAFGLRPGQRSGVVEGENAAFVVQTTAQRGGLPAELTDDARQSLAEELLQRKRQQIAAAWLETLRDEADIEDFRADGV